MVDMNFFDNIDSTRILCLGDIMLDEYITGTISRISPEAPVPVIQVNDESTVLGGVGNVVRNLASIECNVTLISVVGDDENGSEVAQLLKQVPKVETHLLMDKKRTTTTKTRYISGNQQVLRTDRECNESLGSHLESKILKLYKEYIISHDLVVLSDYAKGFFSPELLESLIQEAKVQNKPILIDPKGNDFNRYKGATLLTPNQNELSLAAHCKIKSDNDLIRAAKSVMKTAELDSIIVTRGSQGMTLVESNGKTKHIKTRALEVFDVSGAGDTVIAMLAACLASSVKLSDAINIANAAAGVVVSKIGTAVVHREELLSALHTLKVQTHEEKIVSWERAVAQIQKWKRLGQRIVFTNGCFDFLHPGHIELLHKAKEAGHKLIIGLNTDHSIQRLKGPKRPIQKERDRSFVLSSIGCVDLIVFFEEDTPLNLIKLLKPDVLVKGADYTIDKVVGASFVQSYGGQVKLVDLVEGKSTSNMVTKMIA